MVHIWDLRDTSWNLNLNSSVEVHHSQLKCELITLPTELMVLNKANPRTGLSARPVGCLLFKRSRHLPIFTGRFQPTIFGTSELNFCVRNGNRWFLTVIDTGHSLTNVSFSFLEGIYLQNWISNCYSKWSINRKWGQALDLLVHPCSMTRATYTLCLSTL